MNNGQTTTRVAVTGIGAVTPFGLGAGALWNALSAGESAIAPTSHFPEKRSAEVKPCDWQKLIGRKDSWSGSRSVNFALGAAKLAIEDAGLDLTPENGERTGVSVGTTLACLNLMARFDQQALREGPRTCDPMMFPDTGVSAPACRISIVFGIRAFNTTLSNGATSGLDAIYYGAEMIRRGLVETVLAGGVEEICTETFALALAQGLLSGSVAGQSELCAPFDRRRNGIVLGEGCVILALEDYERARARGARIVGEVLGYGSAFDPGGLTGSGGASRAVCRSMRKALADATLDPGQVDMVACSANSSLDGDLAEAQAIRCVFGAGAQPLLTAVKSMAGESFSASGVIEAAACLLAMRHGLIPPTIGCDEPDPACALDGLVREPRNASVRVAMVNATGRNGNAATLLLAAPSE